LSTGPGIRRDVVVLSPSCPRLFKPQHITPPPETIAQPKPKPPATACAPLASPDTGTGAGLLSACEPSPSSP
jgi:hypothetical protein